MKKESKNNLLFSIIGLLIFIVFWFILSFFVDRVRLPSPVLVFKAFLKSFHYYPLISSLGGGVDGFKPHIIYTIRTYCISTSIGIFSGIFIGIIMAWNKYIYDFLEPPINILRAIPSMAILPFFIMWFGPIAISQILLISLYCFFMIVVTTLNAIKNIDPIYAKFAYTQGASKWQMHKTIIAPAIVPELVGGIRVCLASSWGFVVLAELMGAPYGVGKLFLLFIPFFHSTGIFVGIMWIILFAVITDMVCIQVGKYFTKWMYREIQIR